MPQINLAILFIFLAPSFLGAQLSGHVLSSEGDTLSFASIYIKGSSIGTSSNLEGKYILNLDPGEYEIVYQYIGYQTKIEEINLGSEKQIKNIILEPEIYKLEQITLTADGEDPAYPVIRNAIRMRKYYKDLEDSYSCKVYVKGNQKILSIPEKILGQEIGDLEGLLDSTRKGIVYLSETVSNYYFKEGESKEVIVSSKLSGDDSGYSFNSAQEMEFNVYENSFELNRDIVSPIANNAFSYYRYQLLGTSYDDNNRLINKIKVIPKRSTDPIVEGIIYIIEDLWNVHSFKVNVPSTATQLSFLDSLIISQVFVPVKEPDVYKRFSNTISFELKLLGVHLDGKFSAVYADYDLNPVYPNKFFNNEIYSVEKESNKRSYEYWDSIRPVPLTTEEDLDYHRKDSLQLIKKSPEYLDSIDRENNKFKLTDLLFGYSFQNSKKKTAFAYNSIIENFSFNTIQGWNLNPRINFSKDLNEEETKTLRIGAEIGYGFSEEKLRLKGDLGILFNRRNYERIKISGGQEMLQFNDEPPISEFLNSFYSLFHRRNYAKYYDRKFIQLEYQKEIINGLKLESSLEYADRNKLNNVSDYSFFFKDTDRYTSNQVEKPVDEPGSIFENHKALIFDINTRIRFSQKYFSYPDRKFSIGSPYPDLWFHISQGWYLDGENLSFTHLAMTIKESFDWGVYGSLLAHLNGGTFLGAEAIYLPDYKHFNGNQVFLGNSSGYIDRFLLLPYYNYSINSGYFQAHLEYHFNGFLLDRLPLFNKLAWSIVGGAKHLHTSEINYNEFYFGIDRLGLGFLRLFRLDFAWSFEDLEYRDFGIRLGVGFGN